jgi:uncharacterized protein (TIGR01777 family)
VAEKPKKNNIFLVSGASGLIGTSLIRSWIENRIHVMRIIRSATNISRPGPQIQSVIWDPSAAEPISDPSSLSGVHAAVHLSGATVAGPRWTEKYKREIVTSRVRSTNAISKLLARLDPPPAVLVCASAIGIYGDRGEEILTESSTPGSGFLAETCVTWEDAARAAEDAGIRVVHARFGVVLSPDGGALARLLPIFRLGLGGPLADGRAWMPWVTLRDVVGILNYCIANQSVRGPVNVVAPNPATNADFTRALGSALHRPAVIPVPAFGLRLAFGQMADEALLASARVVPAKLSSLGYPFADPEIGPALATMLRH